jgi:hypothetical protein
MGGFGERSAPVTATQPIGRMNRGTMEGRDEMQQKARSMMPEMMLPINDAQGEG